MTGKKETKDRKELFLKKYEYFGTVWPACRAVGLKRRATPYEWCKSDKEFAEAFEEIQSRVEDDIASRLILAGKGQKKLDADQIRSAIFTLKSLNPRKYAEKYQHEMAGSGEITVRVKYDN